MINSTLPKSVFGKIGTEPYYLNPALSEMFQNFDLRTYRVDVKGLSKEYVKTILDLPAFKEWEKAVEAEPWVIKRSEIYNPKYKTQDQQ